MYGNYLTQDKETVIVMYRFLSFFCWKDLPGFAETSHSITTYLKHFTLMGSAGTYISQSIVTCNCYQPFLFWTQPQLVVLPSYPMNGFEEIFPNVIYVLQNAKTLTKRPCLFLHFRNCRLHQLVLYSQGDMLAYP